jgi:opacity protein-like surface antigen
MKTNRHAMSKEMKMVKLMVRSWLTAVLLSGFIALLANPLHAADKRFYIGLGGSYQITNFDLEDEDRAWDEDDFDWDSNAWGVNAKFGYWMTRNVAFQFDVDYISRIDWDYKPDDTLSGEVEILTGILSLKGYFPNTTVVRPFVIAGVGILYYDIDFDGRSDFTDDDEMSVCFKLGGGLDWFITQAVSIGLEGNYTAGVDDVEGVEYFNFILGAAYHF